MRESIGSALLLNIVIVIIGIISAFLVGSIAYSKAFKTKNRIISVIEDYRGNCNFKGYRTDNCTKAIEAKLDDIGYSSNISRECPIAKIFEDNHNDKVLEVENIYKGNRGHHYCVYKYTLCDITYENGHRVCSDDSNVQSYYKVITFMHFDIPLIGQFLEFSVSGETKLFYDTFINISE